MRRKPKVVSFYPGMAPPTPAIQPAVVDRLKSLLREAQDGQIIGFAFSTVTPARAIGSGWVGNCDEHLIIAGTTILRDRVMAAYRVRRDREPDVS